MTHALRAALLCGACVASGCWPGWTQVFEQVPSREHRVEDLRVLAIDVEPASIVVPAQVAYGDANDEVSLTIRPRIFDPRGGEIALGVSLCAALDFYTACSGGGLDVVQRTVRADADEPLGPVDTAIDLRLDREALAQLWRDVNLPFPSLTQIAVHVTVSVVREVDGVAEREVAVLPVIARVDPDDPIVPDVEIDEMNMIRCDNLEQDRTCGGSEVVGNCGDGEINPGEACDPPTIDMCSAECQSAAICPIGLPRVCVRPALPNQRPRVLGLVRGRDLFNAPRDITPDIEPGARIPVGRGERISLLPVLASTDEEQRPTWIGTPLFEDFSERPPDGAIDAEAGCPLLTGYMCPAPELLSTRWYIADGAAELVGPEDGLGGYGGNGSGAVHGVTVALGDDAAEEPLVVVLGDGAGGMSVTTFILVVE